MIFYIMQQSENSRPGRPIGAKSRRDIDRGLAVRLLQIVRREKDAELAKDLVAIAEELVA